MKIEADVLMTLSALILVLVAPASLALLLGWVGVACGVFIIAIVVLVFGVFIIAIVVLVLRWLDAKNQPEKPEAEE